MAEQYLRIVMKLVRSKDWVHLVSLTVLTMNSQRSSSAAFTPHEPFHGERPAWLFKTLLPRELNSLVGDWLDYKQ